MNRNDVFGWFWSLVLLVVVLVGCDGRSGSGTADGAKGTRVWMRQMGSSSTDIAYGVSTDSRGNIFIVGETFGSLDGTNAGSSDAFLTMYDVNGKRLWTRQLGSRARDAAYGVSTDSRGNVFMAGLTFGSLDGTNAGSDDAFVAKYDANGKHLWTRQIGTPFGDYASSVSTDTRGNVFIAGETFGSLAGTNAGVADAFLAKYDANGRLLWTNQMGSSSSDVAKGISTDDQDNAYIAGQTDGSLDGMNVGSSDAFLARYDANGKHLWTRQLGSSSLDAANGVSTDRSGNVFLAGETFGSLGGTNAGGDDAFVAKYDADGKRLWTRQLGSRGDDGANGVSTDNQGNVSLAGQTNGSLDGTNAGSSDAFVARYDADGKRLWIKQLGSRLTDVARSVSTDNQGNVYLAGQTNGNLDGTNMGEFDAFVARYL